MISFFCSRDIQVFLLCKFVVQVLLKLGRDVAPFEIYQMVHIFMLLWQHARFQSLVFSKSNSTIIFVAARGKIYKKCCKEETQWNVELTYVLDKTRYFALFFGIVGSQMGLFEAFHLRKYKPSINSREECSEVRRP